MGTMTEDNREAPAFGVQIVTAAAATMQQHKLAYALQDVYDIAINSLDFGSGFLSTEEIGHLRELGRAIGAEPLHYQCSYDPDPVQITTRVPWPNGPMRSVKPDPRPCTCGALSVIDGEVVTARPELPPSTPAG
jgi:hypothetical protein